MKIDIIARSGAGTEFLARPHRLHLGGQDAEGVDTLEFQLPSDWADKDVTLYIEHSDGTQATPVTLDESRTAEVDRKFTAWPSGRWMLTATDGQGYTACTRPGVYDVYGTLSTDGSAEDPSPTLYEQFVARVLESSNAATQSAKNAAQSEASAASSADRAETAAQQAQADGSTASSCADRAEAAAQRAEELAPAGGQVTSVNGKGGAVKLTADDVGAVPLPAVAAVGQLLRVLSIDPDTGAMTTETVAQPDLTGFVQRSDLPTAEVSGPVKVDAQYGVTVRTDGTLATAPVTQTQLDSMTDGYAPLVSARLPYGVKKALAAFSDSAGWTDSEKAAVRTLLGIADVSDPMSKSVYDADGDGVLTPSTLPLATQSAPGAMSAGDKAKLDGLGSAAPVLLWENDAPDSSFSAQTVALDLSGYSRVLVRTGNHTAAAFVGFGGTLLDLSTNTANDAVAFRRFQAAASGVTFEGSYTVYNSAPKAYANETRAVPAAIYGIV